MEIANTYIFEEIAINGERKVKHQMKGQDIKELSMFERWQEGSGL